MIVGIWYIVTYPSNDCTFVIGDHIKLESDGSIICREAQGWIDAEDAGQAEQGMQCQEDAKERQKRVRALRAELDYLEGLE